MIFNKTWLKRQMKGPITWIWSEREQFLVSTKTNVKCMLLHKPSRNLICLSNRISLFKGTFEKESDLNLENYEYYMNLGYEYHPKLGYEKTFIQNFNNFSDLIHNQITLPPSWSPIFNQVYSEFRSFQSLDWINLQGRLVQIKRIEHGEKIKNLLNNSIRQYGDSLVKKIPNWKSLISSWT